jgi:DNA polymerase-1
MSDEKTILLVDGSSLAFRSYFALLTSGLRRSDGLPTWAVLGFFNSLFDVLERFTPDCIAIAFDVKKKTFRHEEFQDYKATRNQMPDDLSRQWPVIKEGLTALNVPVYELEGYEADDLIGTVALKAIDEQLKVHILTGDHDAFQLLDGKIQVLMPSTKEGLKTYGPQECFDKLGVWPDQVTDYKALCGDTSDNIPGVRGIGPKTAVQLLSQYKTIEAIYDNLGEIKSDSTKKKLETGKDSAFMSKSLATIHPNVPFELDFEHCSLSMPDVEKVAEFFREMEFNAILKRLPKILSRFNNGDTPEIDPVLLEPLNKARRSRRPYAEEVEPGHYDQSAPAKVPVAVQERLPLHTVQPLTATAAPIVRSQEELDKLLSAVAACTVVSLEFGLTNAMSLEADIAGIALAWSDAASFTSEGRFSANDETWNVRSAYIPMKHQTDSNQLPAQVVLPALKGVLENKEIGKVGFNLKHALNAASLQGITIAPLLFDPMLASYIINPDGKHKLKDQAERLLSYSLPDIGELLGTGKKQITVDYLPVESAAHALADAARVSLELTRYYAQSVNSDQDYLMWEMDLPLASVLACMEQNGVKLDQPFFESYAVELAVDLERLEKEIFELSGHAFNIGSPVQLQKVLFEELKLPTKTKTKSGYSTDASVLESLKEHAIVAKILEFRQLSKLHSTYVVALPRLISPRSKRLHGEFNQTTTATGRLSSTNPNLQNIPIRTERGGRIRKGFIASDNDHLLVSADYSQIELRLLAHMSGDEKLIEAFGRDEDIHARTARDVFDVPTGEEVTADMRRVGKTLNFALIYQQGSFATAQALGISTKEAQKFIDKYFATYPKVRAFMSSTIASARQLGYVETLWGRRRYFLMINDSNDPVRKAAERAACNAPLQGSAADLIKLAMVRLEKDLEARKLDARLILQVHDELVFDVPKNQLDETKEAIRAAMSLDQPLRVPLRIDIGQGSNWGDCK